MDKLLIVVNSKSAREFAKTTVSKLTGDVIHQVTIEPYKDDKTAEQRKGWHFLLSILAKHCGYTLPEIKDVIKIEAIGMQQMEWKGKIIDRIPSSEEEKKHGYSDLIEQTYRIAAEMGCVLPELKR